MNDPLAFFLTWSTYGSWLPGDARGWTEYHHGWQMSRCLCCEIVFDIQTGSSVQCLGNSPETKYVSLSRLIR